MPMKFIRQLANNIMTIQTAELDQLLLKPDLYSNNFRSLQLNVLHVLQSAAAACAMSLLQPTLH